MTQTAAFISMFADSFLHRDVADRLHHSPSTTALRSDHEVDADPVTVTYAVPAATVTHTAAPDIAVADFDQAGLRPPIVLAVFQADISGNYLTGPSNDVEPTEGEVDVSSTLTFGRIERRAGNVIRLYRDSGSTGRADTYFDTPGSPTYPAAQLFIQTAAGGRAEYDSANSGNNANFDLAAGEDATVVSGISTGDYFLVAIAEPTVAHEVDADPVTVAYACPCRTSRTRCNGHTRRSRSRIPTHAHAA